LAQRNIPRMVTSFEDGWNQVSAVLAELSGIAELQEERSQAEQQLFAVKEELRDVGEQVCRVQEELHNVEEEVKHRRSHVEKLQEEVAKMDAQLKQKELLETELYGIQQLISASQSHLKDLQDITDREKRNLAELREVRYPESLLIYLSELRQVNLRWS